MARLRGGTGGRDDDGTSPRHADRVTAAEDKGGIATGLRAHPLLRTGWEGNVSKAPGEVDALLIRIRTMKWQAVSVLSSSRDGLAREDAAALIAALDGIACALARDLAPEAVQAARERIEGLARERDHAPLHRSAGRA